jgi:hypothetical protein
MTRRIGLVDALGRPAPLRGGLFGHPLLHHGALQQLLLHEGIGRNDPLRLLERIGLESDQASPPIGERPAH